MGFAVNSPNIAHVCVPCVAQFCAVGENKTRRLFNTFEAVEDQTIGFVLRKFW